MTPLILAMPKADEVPQAPGGSPASPLGGMLIPLLLVMLVFVLMPMFGGKKDKQRRARVAQIKKHDKVVTTTGMYGTVVAADDESVTLEVAKDVRIRFRRAAIHDLETVPGAQSGEAAGKPAPSKG